MNKNRKLSIIFAIIAAGFFIYGMMKGGSLSGAAIFLGIGLISMTLMINFGEKAKREEREKRKARDAEAREERARQNRNRPKKKKKK